VWRFMPGHAITNYFQLIDILVFLFTENWKLKTENCLFSHAALSRLRSHRPNNFSPPGLLRLLSPGPF